MTVKELAKAFGISVGQLVTISGYSKQGLYDVMAGKNNTNKNRFNAFLEHLQFVSNSIHEQDIAQARIEKNIRDKMIAELKEREPIE